MGVCFVQGSWDKARKMAIRHWPRDDSGVLLTLGAKDEQGKFRVCFAVVFTAECCMSTVANMFVFLYVYILQVNGILRI